MTHLFEQEVQRMLDEIENLKLRLNERELYAKTLEADLAMVRRDFEELAIEYRELNAELKPAKEAIRQLALLIKT